MYLLIWKPSKQKTNKIEIEKYFYKSQFYNPDPDIAIKGTFKIYLVFNFNLNYIYFVSALKMSNKSLLTQIHKLLHNILQGCLSKVITGM